MCAVLCGLDTLGNLVVYTKSRKGFFAKELGIERIPSKATFGRVLIVVDGKRPPQCSADPQRICD